MQTKRVQKIRASVPEYRTSERHAVLVEHGYVPGAASDDGTVIYYHLESDQTGNYCCVLDTSSGTVAVYSSEYAGPCYLFDSAVALDEYLSLREIFS